MSFFCQHRITSLFILLWPHYTVIFNHFQSNSFIIIKKQSFSFIYASGSLSDFIHICRGLARGEPAGRRDITDVAVGAVQSLSSPSGADQWEAQDGCWNGQQRLGGPLWESREMLFVDIIIRSSQVTKPFLIDQLSISPIVHNGTPKAPFIGELAAEGGLRG